MANYRGRLLETIKTSAKANVDRHLMNAEVLLGSHVGVAEHGDMIETIEKELLEAAKHQDILDIINLIGRVQNPISRCSQLSKNINVYSFALNPEEHQPSGTCNFSKIDKANLILSSSATIDNIYAINYNILKVMSGMGGVLYTG